MAELLPELQDLVVLTTSDLQAASGPGNEMNLYFVDPLHLLANQKCDLRCLA